MTEIVDPSAKVYEFFIEFPNSSSVEQILQNSWQIATYQRLADEAQIDCKPDRTNNAQVLAFSSANDMMRLQEKMKEVAPEYEANLTHTETFQEDDYPHYVAAWKQVVTERMNNNGHTVLMSEDRYKREIMLTFKTEEAQSYFEREDFIDLAISRRNILEFKAGLEKIDLQSLSDGEDLKIGS